MYIYEFVGASVNGFVNKWKNVLFELKGNKNRTIATDDCYN